MRDDRDPGTREIRGPGWAKPRRPVRVRSTAVVAQTQTRSGKAGRVVGWVGQGSVRQREALMTAGATKLTSSVKQLKAGDTVLVHGIGDVASSTSAVLLKIKEWSDRGIRIVTLDGRFDSAKLDVRDAIAVLTDFIADQMQVACGKKPRGREGGRLPKLIEADRERVIAMMAEPGAELIEVAAKLNVTRRTLYNFRKKHGLV